MRDYGRQNSEYISVGNWILTVILMAIPGVNLIAGICYLLSKKKSKRNYVLALIVLILIVLVLLVGAFFLIKYVFPDTYDVVIDFVRNFLTSVGIDLPLKLLA